MICPYCYSDKLGVIDSRHRVETNTICRRRECNTCSNRFTTFETIEESSIDKWVKNKGFKWK